ncbi:MAG: type II toxin-antitoxin system RelE family toxin [Bryobacteraceae bacterium]
MLLRRTRCYVLKFTSSAVADIKLIIPKHLRGPLQKELLEKLAADPVGCSHKLRGDLEGYRSFTWQKYRVVYRVFDDLLAVAVVGVGLRSPQSAENLYRKLEPLARTGELAQGVLFSIRGFTKGAQ